MRRTANPGVLVARGPLRDRRDDLLDKALRARRVDRVDLPRLALLCNEEWTYVEPHMSAPKGYGRPRILLCASTLAS